MFIFIELSDSQKFSAILKGMKLKILKKDRKRYFD